MFIRRQPPPGSGLHQCPLCHDDSVVPVEAAALDYGQWGLRLRCGQCGTCRDVVVSDDVVQALRPRPPAWDGRDRCGLERHDPERMTAEAEVFIAALEHDIIDAGDFGSG